MQVKTIALVTVSLFFTLFSVVKAEAKGWRGIVPLHSTRADVERLLGQPEKKISEFSDFYRTPNETVMIDYAGGLPCGIGKNYSRWRVPRNTVENIFITPNRGSPLSQVRIDENKYNKTSGGHTPDVYYTDEVEGERLTVSDGIVKSISYFPAAEDVHLECPDSPKRPEPNCSGVSPSELDSYGDIGFEREKWLLDNFVLALKNQENARGYIIAYAGKRARVREALNRGARAKTYLVKGRSFPASRLQISDGGYREEPAVELYVVPEGVCPPIATPTVDPRDVQIIRSSRSKKNRRSS